MRGQRRKDLTVDPAEPRRVGDRVLSPPHAMVNQIADGEIRTGAENDLPDGVPVHHRAHRVQRNRHTDVTHP